MNYLLISIRQTLQPILTLNCHEILLTSILKNVHEFCYFSKYINQLAGKGELTLNRCPVSDSNCKNYSNSFLGQLGQINP